MKGFIGRLSWIKVFCHYVIICLLTNALSFYFLYQPNINGYLTKNDFFTSDFGIEMVWTYFELVPLIVPIAVVLAYSYVVLNKMPSELGFKKRKWALNILMGSGIGFFLFSLCVLLSLSVGSLAIEGWSDTASLSGLSIYFIGFLIQGLQEEILFRGYLFNELKSKMPVLGAILVSSIFFSLSHLSNQGFTVVSFVNLMIWGIFVAILYLKYDNIWIVAAFHGTWNYVQGNIYGISISGNVFDTSLFTSISYSSKELLNGGKFGLEGGLSVSIIIVGVVVLVWINSQSLIIGSGVKTK